MSWSSLISCRWTFQRLPKMDSQKTLKPSFASWLKDSNAYDKTLTDAQLSHFKWSLTLIVVHILWRKESSDWLNVPVSSDWLILTFSSWDPEMTIGFSWVSPVFLIFPEPGSLCRAVSEWPLWPCPTVRVSPAQSWPVTRHWFSLLSLSHSLCPSHVKSW